MGWTLGLVYKRMPGRWIGVSGFGLAVSIRR